MLDFQIYISVSLIYYVTSRGHWKSCEILGVEASHSKSLPCLGGHRPCGSRDLTF